VQHLVMAVRHTRFQRSGIQALLEAKFTAIHC
jgi:hypothetical protein